MFVPVFGSVRGLVGTVPNVREHLGGLCALAIVDRLKTVAIGRRHRAGTGSRPPLPLSSLVECAGAPRGVHGVHAAPGDEPERERELEGTYD